MNRIRSGVLAVVVLAFASAATTARAETGHYPHGAEGLKAPSLPGPGFYVKDYNLYYHSDVLKDKDGDKVDVDFNVDVFLQAPRIFWVTETKILGADYAFDVTIPLVHAEFSIDELNIDESETRLGDLLIEPFILSWHGTRWDMAFGFSVFLPTGDPDPDNPALGNKNFWSFEASYGITYYPDEEKTWAASILMRTEVHTKNPDNDLRAGQDFHFEWGIAKTLSPGFDVGVAGYAQWQIADDEGSGVVGDPDVHDQTFAAGPEVTYFIPSWKVNLSLRHEWEFGVIDRSEGEVTVFSVTKIF